MDPNATVQLIKEARADDDMQTVVDLKRTLRQWVGAGNFEPDDKNWRNA